MSKNSADIKMLEFVPKVSKRRSKSNMSLREILNSNKAEQMYSEIKQALGSTSDLNQSQESTEVNKRLEDMLGRRKSRSRNEKMHEAETYSSGV